jgi:tetratricopeptide (TPR) repeat protein
MSFAGGAGRVLLLLLVAATGVAADEEDPDTEVSRRHFELASDHYRRRDYTQALREFEAARRAKPLPQFDYNIGRCNDRLERYPEAIVAYRRYLTADPGAKDAGEVRQRITVLESRVAAEPPPATVVAPPATVITPPATVVVTPAPATATVPAVSAPPPQLYRRGWFWAVIGGVAIVGVGVGLGVGLAPADQPPTSDGGNFPVKFS